MNFSIKTLFSSIIAIVILFSCGEKHPKNNSINTTDSTITSVDIDNTPSKVSLDKSIYGIWVFKKKKGWLEFHKDGTYSMGNGEEIRTENSKFVIDEANSVLLIETKKGNKDFSYRFENGFLFIKAKGKEKEFKYRRSDNRPI